jgi:hypothetical protein
MVDAYTIGITLALDNGVSAGLETIRRDLVTLNGVADGSATRLIHLTRAAADLRSNPGIIGRAGRDPVPPAPNRVDGIELTSTDWSQFDPRLFPPSPPICDLPIKAATPGSPVVAIQPRTEVGRPPASQPGAMLSGAGFPTQDFQRASADMMECWAQGARVSDLFLNGYPSQTLNLAPRPRTAGDGSADSDLVSPDPAPSRWIGSATDFPQPRLGQASVSASQNEDHLSRCSSRQKEAESQTAPLQSAGSVPYDRITSTPPPSTEPILPSAVSPRSERQSAAVQGDIYVDGSRLGRWMTDRLVKTAELPRGATTGFDPRMTASWPGSPVSA